MPLLIPSQRTDEWHAARRGKVTASLAAACLGLDPYRGPLAAWNTITGRTAAQENSYMLWGTLHEAEARSEYEVSTGLLVEPTGLWVHPEHSWLLASPDGLIGQDGLLEIKCPQLVEESILPGYLIQMAVQMAVSERSWCDFFAWSLARTWTKRVTRVRSHEPEMISRLYEFYRRYVEPDIAPPRTNFARNLSQGEQP